MTVFHSIDISKQCLSFVSLWMYKQTKCVIIRVREHVLFWKKMCILIKPNLSNTLAISISLMREY